MQAKGFNSNKIRKNSLGIDQQGSRSYTCASAIVNAVISKSNVQGMGAGLGSLFKTRCGSNINLRPRPRSRGPIEGSGGGKPIRQGWHRKPVSLSVEQDPVT